MKCQETRAMLVLHAAGDLPTADAQRVTAHLDNCPDCSDELRTMQRALAAVDELALADQPDPLPANFTQRVRRAVAPRPLPGARPGWRDWLLRPPGGGRLFYGGAAALATLLVVIAVWNQPWPGDGDGRHPDIQPPPVVREDRSRAVRWSDLREQLADCLQGPYRLAGWDAPDQPGVVAIMHRPDPESQPDTFVIDYCGEWHSLSAGRGYTWIRQRARRLVAHAGSADNIYVAVCLMTEADQRARREIKNALIREFDPRFNRRAGG